MATAVAMDLEDKRQKQHLKNSSSAPNQECTKIGDFDGTSKWKQEHNGKMFYWSGKCERWSVEHPQLTLPAGSTW
jgi:hypothetical protein